jgi:hypothetical protein
MASSAVAQGLSARAGAWAHILRRGEVTDVLPRWTELPGEVAVTRRVVVDRALDAPLAAALQLPESGERPSSEAALRRAVRFAQVDAELDPLDVHAWLEGPADAAASPLSEVLARLLGRVGRGAGGEAVAGLGYAALLGRARHLLRAAGAATRPLASELLRVAMEMALARAEVAGSARLGRVLALLPSPSMMGATLDAVARRPVNAYRTTSAAVGFARRVLEPPLRGIPLPRVIDAVSARLLAEPALAEALLRDLRLERVRGAALVARARGEGPPELRRLLTSGPELVAAAGVASRRAAWIRCARSGPGRALEAMAAALETAPRREEAEPRARLAATGAVVAVLDASLADAARRELGASLEEDLAAWAAGEALRVTAEPEPPVRPPRGGPRLAAAFEVRPASLEGTRGRELWTTLRARLLDPIRAATAARAEPGWLTSEDAPLGLTVSGVPRFVLEVVTAWAQVARRYLGGAPSEAAPETDLDPLDGPAVALALGLAVDLGAGLGAARAWARAAPLEARRGALEVALGSDVADACRGLADAELGPDRAFTVAASAGALELRPAGSAWTLRYLEAEAAEPD